MTTLAEWREASKEIIRNEQRLHDIVAASCKDENTDKVKLTKEERIKLCQEGRLGHWEIGENGEVEFKHHNCNHYDGCSKCRLWEAKQRRDRMEDNVRKYKEEHPGAKKRVKRGIPESEVEALEKRIKRHGGTFHSAEGELPGTKDIIAIMEDDPKRDAEQMEDIYGVEDFEYDYEESLARQAERSSSGEQKRMAGPLLKKGAMPQQEDTYRLRLPKFKIRPENDGQVRVLARQCKPRREAHDELDHQRILYEIANEFGGLLEKHNIEYDIKIGFKNVTARSRNELNAKVKKCPDNSLSDNNSSNTINNGVNRTKVLPESSSDFQEYNLDDYE